MENHECEWCALPHPGKCALVKAYELDKKGRVIRVEFFSPLELRAAASFSEFDLKNIVRQ